MTLREEILSNTQSKQETISEELIYSFFVRSFVNDYNLGGKKVIRAYKEFFGEEIEDLLLFIVENNTELNEVFAVYSGSLLFEGLNEEKLLTEYYKKSGNTYTIDAKEYNEQYALDKLTKKDAEKSAARLRLGKEVGYDDGESKASIRKVLSSIDHNNKKTSDEYESAMENRDLEKIAADKLDKVETADKLNVVKKATETMPDAKVPVAPNKTEVAAKVAANKGLLAKIWEKIKNSGQSIKAFFQANPAILKTLGIAGGLGAGVFVISKLLKAFKSRNMGKTGKNINDLRNQKPATA